jgi:hypothetical protein
MQRHGDALQDRELAVDDVVDVRELGADRSQAVEVAEQCLVDMRRLATARHIVHSAPASTTRSRPVSFAL